MRLIDADAVINAIIELRKELIKCKSYDEYDRAFFQGENDGLIEAENIVKHSLTIEPERKKGKWIRHDEIKNVYGGIYIECSECGEKYVVQHIKDEKHCRNCGADMRQGDTE